MRLHTIQHVPFEGLGHIRHWAEIKNASFSVSLPFQSVDFPHPDEFDVLVIMGGPMGVHDHDQHPWILNEKHFIEQALKAGKQVIGVCLGAQMIADVLGGTVTRNQLPEIGWFPIRWTDEAKAMPMFAGLPELSTVYHWHFDAFSLPSGAVRLAYSEATENQAFLYGDQALALQCHLEMEPRVVQSLVSRFPEVLDTTQHYIQSAEVMLEDNARFEQSSHFLYQILNHFVKKGCP
ncbi:MAG: amidotransferase [Gammaproteobacteria bacterium CG11_big_fil_rev_8_21_14_0_20_46_22]|nr:MAG: amidotransferase [Gammaproteobacteria bacterium CG12_big_fil_rev_8_21_14_0_65_46_12]PIR10570.1 MAG: amidotransferase [Gammaproteobacteria bacterium CG11_big_fil_rev_8_21_14_0_20_46_22]